MTPSPTATPVLYTVPEVAAILRVHPQWVRRLHRDGELAFMKSGKQHLTSAGELDKFIAELEHRSDRD